MGEDKDQLNEVTLEDTWQDREQGLVIRRRLVTLKSKDSVKTLLELAKKIVMEDADG